MRVALDDPNRGGVLGMAATLCSPPPPNGRARSVAGSGCSTPCSASVRPIRRPASRRSRKRGRTKGRSRSATRWQLHRSEESCARCHDAIDPLGLALENFGPLGEWRAGTILGKSIRRLTLPGGERVAGPAGLKSVLVTKYREPFLRNVCERMLAYALGRAIEYSDRPTIDGLAAALKANDYRSSVLVKGIVASIPFQYRED